VFGIQNNIVEAIRLGEKMMVLNGDTLPAEMARAVKTYLVTNSHKYQELTKRSGPIDTTSIYRRSIDTTEKDGRVSIMNMDDEYWQEFIAKNFRA